MAALANPEANNTMFKLIVTLACSVILVIAPAYAGTDFVKVPVQGELKQRPGESPGKYTMVLVVRAEAFLESLKLEIRLPQDVVLVSGETHAVFQSVKAGQNVNLTANIENLSRQERTIIATATTLETAHATIMRSFVVDIDVDVNKRKNAPEPKLLRDGNQLYRMY